MTALNCPNAARVVNSLTLKHKNIARLAIIVSKTFGSLPKSKHVKKLSITIIVSDVMAVLF